MRGRPVTDEPDRFGALFFANASRLVRLAALLGDKDPEDVVQESFCKTVRPARGRLRDDDAEVVSYLNKIVVSQVRSRHRRRQVALRDPDLLLSTADTIGPTAVTVITGQWSMRWPEFPHASGRRWCCGSGWTCRSRRSRTRWASDRHREVSDSAVSMSSAPHSVRRRSDQHEERLTRALHEEAERINTDVERMYSATLRRLTTPGVVVPEAVLATRGHPGRACAAGRLGRDPAAPRPRGSRARRHQQGGWRLDELHLRGTDHRRRRRSQAGRLVPAQHRRSAAGAISQERIAQAAADEVGAPRYSYVENGDDATLRLGNADGSLASISTFRRTEAGWDLVTTTKCAAGDGGILVPVDDPLRLGARGTQPYPARSMIDNPASAVLFDDRSTYDVAGLSNTARYGPRSAAPGSASSVAPRTGWCSPRSRRRSHPGTSPFCFSTPTTIVGRARSLVLWVIFGANPA